MRKAGIILTALCILLAGCKTTKRVTKVTEAQHDTLYQDVVSIDTLYKTLYKLDSIYLHDSVYQTEYLKGDTFVQYKYVEKVQYRDRVKRDTVYKSSIKHDTTYIAKTDTVTKVDTKVTTKTSFLGGIRWLFGGLLAGAAGLFFLKNFKNNG